MKTVELNIEDLKKAHKEGTSENKALLNKLFPNIFGNSLDRINGMEDVFAEAGVDPADYEMPRNATKRQIRRVTGEILDLIYEVYKEGWEADFNDSSTPKYRGYNKKRPGVGWVLDHVDYAYSATGVGARHVLPSDPLVRDLYKKFMPQISAYLDAQ